jgi:hypothetical protein
VPDHVTGHVAGHVMGQTRFGHVTFPRSRASEVPESRFVTLSDKIEIELEQDWDRSLLCLDEDSCLWKYLE